MFTFCKILLRISINYEALVLNFSNKHPVKEWYFL